MPENNAGTKPELSDAAVAAIALIGRTGAKECNFGFLHDNVPSEAAAWWAYAQYSGARITVEDKRGPAEALEALARKALTGAKCKCGSLVALADDQAVAFQNSVLVDGTTWTAREAEAAGQCRWRRVGSRWVGACGCGGA